MSTSDAQEQTYNGLAFYPGGVKLLSACAIETGDKHLPYKPWMAWMDLALASSELMAFSKNNPCLLVYLPRYNYSIQIQE